MRTTNIQNINFYKEMHNVINRNRPLEFKIITSFKGDFDDSKAVVNIVKENYPEEYQKAESIVNNPNRKVISFWEDEVDYIANKMNLQELEYEEMYNLTFDFMEENGLNDKFVEFLERISEDNSPDEIHWISVDDLILNYQN